MIKKHLNLEVDSKGFLTNTKNKEKGKKFFLNKYF